MKSGLLWYDAQNRPIWEKIDEAARRYKQKFGITPNTCFVNPLDLSRAGNPPVAHKWSVQSKPTILPNHIWLGVNEN